MGLKPKPRDGRTWPVAPMGDEWVGKGKGSSLIRLAALPTDLVADGGDGVVGLLPSPKTPGKVCPCKFEGDLPGTGPSAHGIAMGEIPDGYRLLVKGLKAEEEMVEPRGGNNRWARRKGAEASRVWPKGGGRLSPSCAKKRCCLGP